MSQPPRQFNQRIARLSATQLALVVALTVFVPLTVVFAATGEQLSSAAGQAAFWAAFAVIAALGGRALGRRRGTGGPDEPR